jgi:uncharacterized OB-fold protein
VNVADIAETLGLRALPQPDHASEYYWRSAADGTLVLQRCTSCLQFQFYPRSLCTRCTGETEWVEASGRGTLYTYTVIRQNRSGAFSALSPYAVGIVQLEEGVRMMSNIVECELDDLYVDMPLQAVILKAAEDIGLPFWRPAPTEGG